MRGRMPRSTESLDMHTRPLAPLSLGDKVFLRNQRGSHPKKWDKSGTVVTLGNYDQYWVKMGGSRSLSMRNRRFLRKFVPPTVAIGDPLSHSRQSYGLATKAVLPPTRRVINTDQTTYSALGATHRCSVCASPRLDRGVTDRCSTSTVIHPNSYTG